VPVTKLTAVLNANAGAIPGAPVGLNGKDPWNRRMPYSTTIETPEKASMLVA
jgi:hypothetical protein